ncbi:MAG: hypothetical protein IH597_00310 [Bacteroidales bacterium]|nr:hypothetical protein [Bacteroidales bacterium]
MIKTNKNIFVSLSLFILIALTLGSCSVERRLATEFFKNRHNTTVMVIPADFVYKRNLKKYEVADVGQMEDATLDSVLYTRSIFMQNVSDSIFLETYMNALIKNLRNKGLKVYLEPDADIFLKDTTNKYIVNVAQLMLEENVELLFDPDYDVEYSYIGDFYLNKVSLSSWFEISGVNEEAPKTAVAFAEMTMRDAFDGRLRFFPFTGHVMYSYSVDSIQVDDLYTMAEAAGTEYASYIFDYLLNRYVDRNVPTYEPRSIYFRYDFNTRMLKQAYDERFEFIE